MKRNNFAEHKPTVVLYVPDDNEDLAQCLVGDDDLPLIFPNYKKAYKHVSRFIDAKLWPFITYVNEVPIVGAGDREETHNKRCLLCGGFLMIADEHSAGNGMIFDVYGCPNCDEDLKARLGE